MSLGRRPTEAGDEIACGKVVLTTGTFLAGPDPYRREEDRGRAAVGEAPAIGLSNTLHGWADVGA